MKCEEFVKRFMTVKVKRRFLVHSEISTLGLYFGQTPIMEYIIANDGCTQSQLAQALNITPSSAAISTKRLQKSGMLSKETDDENLRCKKLRVTKLGLETTLKCREILNSVDKKMFEGFSEDEFSALCGYFDRIISNLSDGDSKPLGLFDTVALSHKLKAMTIKEERK